jgi:hypothetical protein
MVRIGIILSVLWFIGFGAYVWLSSTQRLNYLYSHDLAVCSQTFDTALNSGNYEYCLQDARELYLNRVDNYKGRIPRFLAIDFGVAAFAWSVALLGIVITRLIRRAFHP